MCSTSRLNHLANNGCCFGHVLVRPPSCAAAPNPYSTVKSTEIVSLPVTEVTSLEAANTGSRFVLPLKMNHHQGYGGRQQTLMKNRP